MRLTWTAWMVKRHMKMQMMKATKNKNDGGPDKDDEGTDVNDVGTDKDDDVAFTGLEKAADLALDLARQIKPSSSQDPRNFLA